MTLNYRMIVEKYPNRTKWLAIQFLAVKSSLYSTDTSQVVKKHLMHSKNGINKNNNTLNSVVSTSIMLLTL
jgi:hypothetical protein